MPANPHRILVVDDELNICLNCRKILSKLDADVHYALDGYQALNKIAETRFDVIITDLKMSRMGGMELLRRVKQSTSDTQVIVITGYASVSSAVEVMKLGAHDYLPKPFTPDELREAVRQALNQRDLLAQNRNLMRQDKRPRLSHQLIGDSSKIQKVIRTIQKVAPTDASVLVYGESGTGKELVARAVYANSSRQDKVFFAVDCGTLSEHLLESELFGHKKGAFTSAHRNKEGIFALADGGTVFLDEIGNINPGVQNKLLRFLESREFIKLGDTRPQQVNVRLIMATNQNLEELVAQGLFREDFYYRIYVYPIILPPLRERKKDILPIAYHFFNQFSRQMGKSISGFESEAVSHLIAYDWPGNVRQLRNVVERAVILCEGQEISLKDLPLPTGDSDIDALYDHTPATNKELKQVKKEIRKKAVQKVEREFLLNALIKNDWNVTQAAKYTGLQRSNFQSLMKKNGVKLPDKPPQKNGSGIPNSS